jgi:hypothetical protein
MALSPFLVLGWIVVSIVSYVVFVVAPGLRSNIAKARELGVPFIVVRKSRPRPSAVPSASPSEYLTLPTWQLSILTTG